MDATPISPALSSLTRRARFLAAARRQPVDRPPIWFMRQAGRYLPEYRAARAGRTFLDMVHTPAIAAEVTCQPIRRFGFDAAVIFSDILVVPAAMGQPLTFEEKHGPLLNPPVRTRADVDRLEPFDPDRKTGFLRDAIALTRAELGADTPIIGFCGAPWTVASYMVEGASSRDFAHTKAMLHGDPDTLDELLARVVDASIPYLMMQVLAGVDVLQIFDSWGGALDAVTYRRVVLPHLERLIVCAKATGVPVILYVNGGSHLLDVLADAGPDVMSIDWRVDAADAVRRLGGRMALQGNMDPGALLGTPAAAAAEATRVLAAFAGAPGFIFNLGSGILPSTPLECVEAVVRTVQQRTGVDVSGARA